MSESQGIVRLLQGGPLTGAFQNLLRRWDYRPVTSWFPNFFTVNWNAGDAAIEEKVLGDVGSYGLQLSRILAAVELLVGQLDLASLQPDQQKVVVRLQDLAVAARESVAEYRAQPRAAEPPSR